MRLATPPHLVIASREEKEAKLSAFITDDIAAGAAHGYTLLARAPDSPVARALAAASADLKQANIPVRVILFEIDSVSEEHATSSLLDCEACEFRVLNDSRFAAAHEQLTLSGDRVWLGDCMRRDPAKRDAFEVYHVTDSKAATHAAASFAKLWASAKPLKRVMAATVAPQVILAGQAANNAAGGPAPRR